MRADAVTGLRCADGRAEAECGDGRVIGLAESDCPPGFHARLPAMLASVRADSRWLLVISPEMSTSKPCWTHDRVDDLVAR